MCVTLMHGYISLFKRCLKSQIHLSHQYFVMFQTGLFTLLNLPTNFLAALHSSSLFPFCAFSFNSYQYFISLVLMLFFSRLLQYIQLEFWLSLVLFRYPGLLSAYFSLSESCSGYLQRSALYTDASFHQEPPGRIKLLFL